MIPRALWAYLAAFYFGFQTLAGALWWLVVALDPGVRRFFRPANAPDSVLLAFFLPDALLFLGAGAWTAVALWRAPRRARLPLALHVGATGYAALYCAAQTLFTGQAWLAAISMSACALCGAFLGWKAACGSD